MWDKVVKMVQIEWVDSKRPNPTWKFLSDMEKEEVCKCVSVGYLIHDNEDIKVLAPNMADIESKEMQCCGEITIPTASIKKIVPLVEETTSS